MRILAIRGHNLASLEAPFEVDLESDPLASAGLFAITGKTGAGKSTLLDAMCLALYGECPRQTNEGGDYDIPDASGENLKARDPRGVLRQGAHEASAEVDFVGADGARYRASWSARRAHGRSDGKLQKVDRCLTRLADGQVLETQISQINAKVTAITGLSYDEFRRTVLLAQGDFDAFLRANTGERAALLEKVTNTGLYREISRRIFRREVEAKTALSNLQLRAAEHNVLEEATRLDLLEEGRVAREKNAAALTEQETVKSEIARYDALESAKTKVAQSEAALDISERAAQALDADRERLVRHDRLAPLFLQAQDVQRIEGELQDLTRKAETAKGKREALDGDHRAAADAAETAVNAFEEVEAKFKEFGPSWSAAEKLDGEVATAAREIEQAKAQLQKAQQNETDALGTLKELTDRQGTLKETRDTLAIQLEKAAGTAALSKEWPSARPRIEQRAEAARQATEAQGKIADVKGQLDQIAQATGQIEKADQQAESEIETKQQERAELVTRAEKIAETDPAAAASANSDARLALGKLVGLVETWISEEGKSRESASRAAEAREKAQGFTSAAQSARSGAEAATAAIEKLRAPYERLEAAASERAASLRVHLVNGEPCPVCGATEHPIAGDETLSAAAKELREEIAALRRSAEAKTNEAAEAAASANSQETTARDQARESEEAVARAQAAKRSYEEQRASSALEPVRASLPPEPHEGALATLGALDQELVDRARSFSESIAAERALRSQIETKDREIDALRKAIAGRSNDRAQLAQEKSAAETALARASERLEGANRSLDALDPQIAALRNVGLDPEQIKQDPLGSIAEIEGTLASFARLQQDHADAVKELSELEPSISETRAQSAGLTQAREAAEQALQGRQGAHADLIAQRGALLDGEPTGVHRTRWNNKRKAQDQARVETAKALSDVEARRESAKAIEAQLNSDRTAKAEALSGAKAGLQESLDSLGTDLATFNACWQNDPAWAPEARKRIATADEAVRSARVLLKQRQEDLAELVAKGLPETDKDTLVARAATLAQEIESRQSRIGAIGSQIEADDRTRQQLGQLLEKIDAQQVEVDTWTAVSAAVGSNSGDKFARIAQSVTLAILIERANYQLSMLKPRYQLAPNSDLSMLVIDNHMGGERRPTNSLSGGERFLISLALALALSQLGSRGGLAGTLFIDEGFGALDVESLDLAIDALETLQSQGRTIGVISHVTAMQDRIPVQVQVLPDGPGRSRVEVGLSG